MLNNNKIAVVLPAYKAAKTIEMTVKDLPRDIVDDIILVDDASPDDTSTVARDLGLHVVVHPKNRGYGGNQKTCYATALERGADIVIMVHPDYQYSPRLVPAMAGMIASGHYDAVMASRILGKGALAGGMPMWKYIANRGLTAFENIMLGQKMSEYHTGYRAWSRHLLESLDLEVCSDDFVFDNQMIAQALWKGFNFGEISCPTRYFDDASSINFRRSVKYGFGVLETSIRYRLAVAGITGWDILTGDRKQIRHPDRGIFEKQSAA